MLYQFTAALRAFHREAGQSKAEHLLILAPLVAVLALTVCTLIIASSN